MIQMPVSQHWLHNSEGKKLMLQTEQHHCRDLLTGDLLFLSLRPLFLFTSKEEKSYAGYLSFFHRSRESWRLTML